MINLLTDWTDLAALFAIFMLAFSHRSRYAYILIAAVYMCNVFMPAIVPPEVTWALWCGVIMRVPLMLTLRDRGVL